MKSARAPSGPEDVLQALGKQFFTTPNLEFGTPLKLMNAMAAGFERLREIQLEAAREIQAHQQQVGQVLAKGGDGKQLFALQAGLMNDYMSGCVKYWTRLAEAGQQTQAELTRIVQQSGQKATGKPAPR